MYLPAREGTTSIPSGFEQQSHQWKLLFSLSSIPETSWHRIVGGHTGKVSTANSHIPCQAFHFPGNSASVSGQGMCCLCIMVPVNHKTNFLGTNHSLHVRQCNGNYNLKNWRDREETKELIHKSNISILTNFRKLLIQAFFCWGKQSYTIPSIQSKPYSSCKQIH
jgi:hypothetical protein